MSETEELLLLGGLALGAYLLLKPKAKVGAVAPVKPVDPLGAFFGGLLQVVTGATSQPPPAGSGLASDWSSYPTPVPSTPVTPDPSTPGWAT